MSLYAHLSASGYDEVKDLPELALEKKRFEDVLVPWSPPQPQGKN